MFEIEAVHCQGWVKKSHPCPPSDKWLPSTPGSSSLTKNSYGQAVITISYLTLGSIIALPLPGSPQGVTLKCGFGQQSSCSSVRYQVAGKEGKINFPIHLANTIVGYRQAGNSIMQCYHFQPFWPFSTPFLGHAVLLDEHR